MMNSRGIAVVTGAGRGVGKVLTERLSAAGYTVVALGRSANTLGAVAADTGAIPVVVDVSDPIAVADSWDRIESEVGVPTLLVNNAGVAGGTGLTWEQPPVDWWRVFETNVLGTFLLSRAVLPAMVSAGRGRIVNVASGAAFYPVLDDEDPNVNSAYMASKAAVIRFSEALAGETAPTGVRVFAISPGMVKTDMTAGVFAEYWDDPDVWSAPEVTADLVEFIGTGALDSLSGRYIHAASDDWTALAERSADVMARDLHTMRVHTL